MTFQDLPKDYTGVGVHLPTGNKIWLKNGKYHRLDGPAFEPGPTPNWGTKHNTARYYIYDRCFGDLRDENDKKAFDLLVNMLKLKGLK